MNKEKARSSLLQLRFTGQSIRDGRILYDDLADFISGLTVAIERIMNTLQTGAFTKQGRPTKVMQLLSALEIVSVTHRSFGLGLDLRRNGHQFPTWDMGEQAIDILMQGFQSMNENTPLPKEYDRSVLIALRDAGRVFERGIDKVEIKTNSSFGIRKVRYTYPVRDQIITQIIKNEHTLTVVQGRLLMFDIAEDKLQCRIHPSIGNPILCKFDEDLTEPILKYARQFVELKGDATFDPTTGKIMSLYIKDLEPIESITSLQPQFNILSAFWTKKNFEELAMEQGIYPVDDWNKISGGFPEEEDFDSFLSAIRSARTD
jgi:hypothetical protein